VTKAERYSLAVEALHEIAAWGDVTADPRRSFRPLRPGGFDEPSSVLKARAALEALGEVPR